MRKILFYNIFFFSLTIFLIEIIFGYWLSKNNFGIHMKQFINDKAEVETNFDGQTKKFIFSRNSLGFRNKEINASEIDVIFNGGSTTIERWIEKKDTIVDLLNNKFKNKNIFLANAGQGGKSSYGYLCDFKYWFAKIENLNPKYYIFYTGINDGFKTRDADFLNCENITSRQSKSQKIKDYIYNSSFFISKIRKIKMQYSLGLGVYKYVGIIEEDNDPYVDFNKAKKIYLNKSNYEFINIYKKNLNKLKNIFDQNNIKPIFITQIISKGLSKELYLINQETKKFAIKNDYLLIKLDEELKLDKSDFYDGLHTKPSGSQKIANYLYVKLDKILQFN